MPNSPRDSRDERPSTISQLIDFGAKDLTQRALNGQLKHAYGRNAEVERVFASLERKRSVILLGEAEVGKTAILHEVVQRMIRPQGAPVPVPLAGTWVVSVSTSDVLTGTHYLGEWQTRLTELLELVKRGGKVLLYFEDIWALPEAGRASDKREGFANLIRPYLERSDIRLLGETTPDNFNASSYGSRALADDHSFLKNVDVLTVEEPTLEATRTILVQVAKTLRHGGTVRTETSAVERALELTRRFLPYQAFPGKAIRLLTEAAQTAADKGAPPRGAEHLVASDEVTATFSKMTGLPEKILSDRIKLRQEEIRAYFDERVIGQEEAAVAVADIVTLIKAEMTDPGRPFGILFFVGPTGVGKTELAKTLAEYLFGSKDKLIRLDMSEFKSPLSNDLLLAQLTEKQRRQSFSVLLLDEIEKASHAVFDLFLQVFSDGRLTDAAGRSVDLRNTIIIMTSNLGNVDVEDLPHPGTIGFLAGAALDAGEAADPAEARGRATRHEVEEYFRPEFINRIDKIVVFQPLGSAELRRIARRELRKALVLEGIERRNILIDFRDEVLDALLAIGYSPQYGVRPLQRAIREAVLLPLARTIAEQPAMGEQMLELVVRDGKIAAEVIPLNAPEQEADEEAEELRERLPVADAQRGGARAMDARALEEAIQEQHARIERHLAGERYEQLSARQQALLEEMSRPSFWDDQERSQRVRTEIYHIDHMKNRFTDLRNRLENMIEAARMIRRHGDMAGLARLVESYEQVDQEIALAEMELLAGDAEASGVETVFLQITPSASAKTNEVPSEAVEWARQLEGMYLGWARRKGYEAESIADPPENSERLLMLRGPNLGRMLAGEAGLHRLERDSDAAPPPGRNRRRPSPPVFLARVEILPVPDAPLSSEAAQGIQVRLVSPEDDGRAERRSEGRSEVRADRRTDGAAPMVAVGGDAGSKLEVRVRAADAEHVARSLIVARLARASVDAPGEELVRVYHLGKTQYVRDKRTGVRDGQPKRVLGGGIDRFVLAYLIARSQVSVTTAQSNGHAE